MKIKLSGIVLTKNNQEVIPGVIRNLKNLAHEIIIIDDNSIDKTRDLSRKLGAIVFKNQLKNFSDQRNYALAKAKHEWVLFLDSDEVLSKNLIGEIVKEIKDTNQNGFYIKRKTRFLGKVLNYGVSFSEKLIRLGKRNSGKWYRSVHEIWKIKNINKTLSYPIIHNTAKNFSDYIEKINRYSSLHAVENKSEHKSSSIFKILFFPTFKFIDLWIFRFGFLDGTRGFLMSVLMAFHSYLSWSKQWLTQKQK